MILPKTTECILRLEKSWLTIWFNRPEKRNSLSKILIKEINHTLDLVENDPSVRGVIFRGKGNVFCAGADLKWMQSIASEKNNSSDLAMQMSLEFGGMFDNINNLSKVTISIVEGACIAGAVGIVSATDFLVTTANAKYALTETRIGLTPAQIAPYIIAKVGMKIGKKLMLLGNVFNGEDAFKIGMADYVINQNDDIESEVLKIINNVKKCSPNAIAVTKKVLNSHYNIDTTNAAKLFSQCIVHDEGREGFASFFEKRKPSWNQKD
tara:strand:- start:323 stop:1120 length:798 start_codon:yes stop_codon:yes gene_type:complete